MTADLQTRITALENQNARLTRWFFLGAVALASVAVMGQASQFNDMRAKHITAESLVITDGQGVAIALGVTEGKPEMVINGNTKENQPSSSLVVHAKNGPLEVGLFNTRDKTATILMSDGMKLRYDDQARGGLITMKSGAGLMLSSGDDAKESGLNVMAVKGLGGIIEVKDRNGKSRWLFSGAATR